MSTFSRDIEIIRETERTREEKPTDGITGWPCYSRLHSSAICGERVVISLSLSLHGLSCACSLDFKFRLSLYIFIPRPRCPKSRAVAPSPTDSVKQTDQEWEREKCSALLKVFRSIDTVRWCVQRNYTGWQREDSFGYSVCWHRSSLKLKAARWNYTRKRWPVDCVFFFWVRRTKSFFDFVSNLETLSSRFYLAYHDRNIFFKDWLTINYQSDKQQKFKFVHEWRSWRGHTLDRKIYRK